MTERNLIKQIRAIVYEDQANPDRINELLLTYRIGLSGVTFTENEVLILCAANVFNITSEMVTHKGRKRDQVLARQMIWKWLKINKPYMTFNGMAKVLSRTDHSIVICSLKSITNLMEFDKDTRQKWELFSDLVGERL